MRRFKQGIACGLISIDPDHDPLHGVQGTVVEVIEDDAGQETGDQGTGTSS